MLLTVRTVLFILVLLTVLTVLFTLVLLTTLTVTILLTVVTVTITVSTGPSGPGVSVLQRLSLIQSVAYLFLNLCFSLKHLSFSSPPLLSRRQPSQQCANLRNPRSHTVTTSTGINTHGYLLSDVTATTSITTGIF